MRKILLMFLCAGLCVSLFGQPTSHSGIVGTWKQDKEGLTFRFNADGTFTMSEEGEASRQAIEQEQRGREESAITSVCGTYTVSGNRIEMTMLVDGKNHRVRMTFRLININTLRMEGQDYRREQ